MREKLAYSLLVACGLAASALAQSPASELQAAVADIERLPPDSRPGVRYLSLYAQPKERRSEAARAASYTLNALSRARAITRPNVVTPTLLRFSISNYVNDGDEFTAWSAAWEKLVEADPYWRLRTEILAASGPTNPAHQAPSGRPATLAVTIDGDWLPADAAAKLRVYSGKPRAPFCGPMIFATARADRGAPLLRIRGHTRDGK